MEMYNYFWKRFLALLIDIALCNMLIMVVAALVGWNLVPLLNLVGDWLYFALMESSEKQATLGKMALGIIVEDLSGSRISFGVATGRYFAKVLSAIPFFAGYIMAAFTDRQQALHDRLAGTVVISSNYAVANSQSIGFQTNNKQTSPASESIRSNADPILLGITGDYAGQSIPLDEKGLTIGRDPVSCNIIISSDSISRMHCIIKFDGIQNSFTLTDTFSSNGTFLESGDPLGKGQAVMLKNGERFFLAGKENMFEVRM